MENKTDYMNLRGKTIEKMTKQNGEMTIKFEDGLEIVIFQKDNDLRIKGK